MSLTQGVEFGELVQGRIGRGGEVEQGSIAVLICSTLYLRVGAV